MLIDSLFHIDITADVKMKCDYILVQNLSISALVALANIFVDNFTMFSSKNESGLLIMKSTKSYDKYLEIEFYAKVVKSAKLIVKFDNIMISKLGSFLEL